MKLPSVPEGKQVLLLHLALEAGKGRRRDLFPAYTVDEIAALDPADIWKQLRPTDASPLGLDTD